MSFLKAKEHLQKFNLDKNILEFDSSSATVSEAAQVINCKEEEIAKTLSFLVNDKAILVVMAGDKKIDNTKFKEGFKVKAKMLAFNDVENLIGHEIGGVCPFGIKENVNVYLDISLKKFEIIYPACGSCNSAVKLTLRELEKASNFKNWVDVCKTIENN